jgi:hypothetical protein
MTVESSLMPARGWQFPLAAALIEYAQADTRVIDVHVHGSVASGDNVLDEWSDLDLAVTARAPAAVADDLAAQIQAHHAPVFAKQSSHGEDQHTVRLVLADLRRIDICVNSENATAPKPAPPTVTGLRHALLALTSDFYFEAVLAAVKAVRCDLLISTHLTLGLARHVLVAAMLVRDHDEHTTHHRHGGTTHDTWAARLAQAPTPQDRGSITAAIRHYTTVLHSLLAELDLAAPDPDCLWLILDAVDSADPGRPCATA